jgi:CheY-like chemotaxis protein
LTGRWTFYEAVKILINEEGSLMKHILVVSAKDEIIENVPKYLALLGYKVKSAPNPKEAIQLFDNGANFDLLITEVERTADVLDMVRHIRKSLSNSELPIIVLAEPDDEIDTALFDSVLKMPLKLKTLGEEVSRLGPAGE